MYTRSLLSRFMSNPSHIHLGIGKRDLRYIQGTVNYGVRYTRALETKLYGLCNSDWEGCANDMKKHFNNSDINLEYSLPSRPFC